MHFLKKYSNIYRRFAKEVPKIAEMSEWFKEHDWKSCVRLKRTGGSNPLLCAKQKNTLSGVFFVLSKRVRRGFEGGAANGSEHFALHNLDTRLFLAKQTIDNCLAGRAAKAQILFSAPNKRTRFRACFLFCLNRITHPKVCFFLLFINEWYIILW